MWSLSNLVSGGDFIWIGKLWEMQMGSLVSPVFCFSHVNVDMLWNIKEEAACWQERSGQYIWFCPANKWYLKPLSEWDYIKENIAQK